MSEIPTKAGEKAQGHSPYGASACERWSGCPGSIAAQAKYPPSKASLYAAEGHAAHDLLERRLKGVLDNVTLMEQIGTKIKTEDGFEILVTEEMVDAVLMHYNMVVEDYEKLKVQGRPAKIQLFIETPVCASSVSKEAWGTLDSSLVQVGNALITHDFKYGKNHVVEAVNNKQLLQYILSLMDTLKCEAFDYIEGVICQPRARHVEGPIRRWRISKERVLKFREEMKVWIAASKAPDAPRIADDDWCTYCRAYADCPAARALVQKNTGVEFSKIPVAAVFSGEGKTVGLRNPEDLTPEMMAKVMSVAPMITSWLKAVDARALDFVERGGEIPCWQLVEGRAGDRKWTDPAKVIEQLEGDLGEALYNPKELRSPADMDGVVGKKIVNSLTSRTPGKKKLAPMTDPRPPAKMSSAAQDFSHIPPPAPAKTQQQLDDEAALKDLF